MTVLKGVDIKKASYAAGGEGSDGWAGQGDNRGGAQGDAMDRLIQLPQVDQVSCVGLTQGDTRDYSLSLSLSLSLSYTHTRACA